MDTQRMQNLIKYKKYTVMDDNWRLVNGNELYNINSDRSQTKNIIEQHPEVAARLAEGYEHWWESIKAEGPNERYGYIKVGTPYENPSRISSHDMLTGKHARVWHQYGAVTACQATGRWKIEFMEDGEYTISLRRFPRESGLEINATFPEQEPQIELENVMQAIEKSNFKSAYLYVADIDKSKNIEEGQAKLTFTGNIPAGKYDMEAQLIDKDGRVYPAYYIYIEK